MTFSCQGLTYRLFNCALCAGQALICSECDRGHRYCCKEHSKEGRRQNRAKTQADYQRRHHETWKLAHKDQQKDYRDRERERARAAQSAALCAAAGVGCGVPALRPVVATDDWQSSSSSAPEKVVVTGSLIRKTQQKETANPVTVITSEVLTEKGFVTAADAVQRSYPATGAVQGGQPERMEECEQAVSSVTDQSLLSPATQTKVSVQAHPATDNTSERLIEACSRHKPMCCVVCDRVPEPFAGVHTWNWGG